MRAPVAAAYHTARRMQKLSIVSPPDALQFRTDGKDARIYISNPERRGGSCHIMFLLRKA